MSDTTNKLAELLPSEIAPELLKEIAATLHEVVQEKLSEEVDALNLKVRAFLRSQMDRIQETAMAELHEEHETFRNAELMDGIKSLLSFEVDREDFDAEVVRVAEETESVEQSNQLLAEELSQAIKENQQMESVISNLKTKIGKLEGAVNTLAEENVELQAVIDTPVESSDRAVVISENEDGEPKNDDPLYTAGNEFLTPEIMAFMPNKD